MTSVSVYCRMRPFNRREKELGNLGLPIQISETEVIIPERNKIFSFDRNFDLDATQEQVFDVIGNRVVDDFMEGYNATQFVYGQTGAGKSWTMMGVKDDTNLCGIIPRSCALMFKRMVERPDGWIFSVEVSYLEIYMESVNDLLDSDNLNLDLRETKTEGVYVQGLSRETVGSLHDIYDIIDRGDKNRKVAETKMNDKSSRSHSVLSIFLEQISPSNAKMLTQMNLVDLAGSERADKTGATGNTLKEGSQINLSLTVLAQVISGLSKSAGGAKANVPYRESKLTRLLQPSLGGNAKTGLSIHISPHVTNLDETISTCEFGKRAKQIKNNASQLIRKSAEQLAKELDALTRQFDELKTAFVAAAGVDVLESVLAGGAMPMATTGRTSAVEQISKKMGEQAVKIQAEIEAEKAHLVDLESESAEIRRSNDRLKSHIAKIADVLESQEEAILEAKKDLEVKDLEMMAIASHLRDRDIRVQDFVAKREKDILEHQRRREEALEDSKQRQESELAELNALIRRQRQMIRASHQENRELRDRLREVSSDISDRNQRLSTVEIKLLKYNLSRNYGREKQMAAADSGDLEGPIDRDDGVVRRITRHASKSISRLSMGTSTKVAKSESRLSVGNRPGSMRQKEDSGDLPSAVERTSSRGVWPRSDTEPAASGRSSSPVPPAEGAPHMLSAKSSSRASPTPQSPRGPAAGTTRPLKGEDGPVTPRSVTKSVSRLSLSSFIASKRSHSEESSEHSKLPIRASKQLPSPRNPAAPPLPLAEEADIPNYGRTITPRPRTISEDPQGLGRVTSPRSLPPKIVPSPTVGVPVGIRISNHASLPSAAMVRELQLPDEGDVHLTPATPDGSARSADSKKASRMSANSFFGVRRTGK